MKKISAPSNMQLLKIAGCVFTNMHVSNAGTHTASAWESVSACVYSVTLRGAKYTLVMPVGNAKVKSALRRQEVWGMICTMNPSSNVGKDH
jgi:hypothetical protein